MSIQNPKTSGPGRPKSRRYVNRNPVTELLTRWVSDSSSTSRELAEKAGISPNALAMFKQGATPLPIKRVWPIAHALGQNPQTLLEATLETYYPEIQEAILNCLHVTCNRQEAQLVQHLRDAKQALECQTETITRWDLTEDKTNALKAFVTDVLLTNGK